MLEKIPGIVKNTENDLDSLPLSIARELRSDKRLTIDQKTELLGLIREWGLYVKEHDIDQSDTLAIRYHLLEFSKNHFSKNKREFPVGQEIQTASIEGLALPDGTSFKEYINSHFEKGVDIFSDNHVAIYGGIARLALKLLTQQQGQKINQNLIDAELPIHDIDVVVDDKSIGNKYKTGIAGTRVVPNLEEYIQTYYRTVDCTSNQVILHKGNLLFTKESLRDNTTGELHFVEKEETLFNPDSVVLEDGKVFVTNKGFYRALSYLLRHKASKMDIYKDNLNAIKGNGYMWASPIPKILSMDDKELRNQSIREWFTLAKQLGVTEASSPDGFLQEIIKNTPEIVGYNFKTEDNNEDEIRWIIGQFLRSGLRTVLPDTYPKQMSDEVVRIDMQNLSAEQYDLKDFFERINTTFENANIQI